MTSLRRWGVMAPLALITLAPWSADAGDRLLATGGVMQVEGAAGGGLAPWALIAGLGTRDQIGGAAFCTRVEPSDFSLLTCGAAAGFYDRVELSFAEQTFDLGTTVPGEEITQRIVGLKIRVLGDAIFDQDSWAPQIAIGAQFKHNEDFDFVPQLLGAHDDSDIDLYIAATKVWLAGLGGRTTLLNGALRATRGNQLGLLGFGGDRRDSYSLVPELSAAVFVHDHVVLGAEYRVKPDNLGVFREEDFWDAFLAVIPTKRVSVTVAYVDLGDIADKPSQRGWYLSLQASY